MEIGKKEKRVIIIFMAVVLLLFGATLIINAVRSSQGVFTKLIINYQGEDVAEISVAEIRDDAVEVTAFDGTKYMAIQLINILASKEVFAMGDSQVFVATMNNDVIEFSMDDIMMKDAVYIAIGEDGEEFDKEYGSFKLIPLVDGDDSRFMDYVIYIEVS